MKNVSLNLEMTLPITVTPIVGWELTNDDPTYRPRWALRSALSSTLEFSLSSLPLSGDEDHRTLALWLKKSPILEQDTHTW